MRKLLPICAVLAAACTPTSMDQPGAVAPINPTSADARAAATSIDAFAADLHAAMPKDGNLFYSPTSVALALAMTEQGARGATKTEMDKVLHAPADSQLGAQTYAALAARFTTSKSPELGLANRIYVDGALSIEPNFSKVAPMEQVDFIHDADGARGKINAWVSDHTKTRIPELIAPNVLDKESRFVIVNAIYFKGAWSQAFDAKLTRDDTFHGKTDTTVKMMHGMLPAALGSHAGAQVLDLAYQAKDGPELSMTVLLPDASHSLADVEAAYEKEGLDPFVAIARAGEVDIALPKMKMSTSFELKDALTAMGMPTAFSNDADFTGVTHTDPIKIARVIHKAFVDVNEEGTEAAASTGVIGMRETAVMPSLRFDADHPFVFFVRDRATGVVLFTGRYVGA